MTAITTSNSTRVKPLPVRIGNPIDAGAVRERAHVVDVGAGARRVERTRVAAQPPGLLRAQLRVAGEWIARNAPQKDDLLLFRALLILDALDQRGERQRIARGVGRLRNAPLIGRALVRVDGLADLAQRVAQLLLLVAPHG